jgi:L-threonylcarbamoyladenylate synthase
VIEAGGVVVVPTDTVYGIACDPHQRSAVERLFRAKRRPCEKPLSLLIATVSELLEYVDGHPLATLAARAFLPGALTVVVRRPPHVPVEVTAGRETLGLRVPEHTLSRAILEAAGPLASTSANYSGRPAYRGGGDTEDLPEADLIVEAGPAPVGRESTVLDFSGPRPRCIREGALSLGALEAALGPIERPPAV